MHRGYVKLWRKISDNDLWLSEPFSRGQAWLDLLILANHKPGYFYCRGIKVPILRGQVGMSEPALAERWKWSRGKVRRFLSEMQTVQQIVQQKNNVTSVITIVNYKHYQPDSTANDTADSTTDGQQTDPNKNGKNVKKKNTPLPPMTKKAWNEKGFKQWSRKDLLESATEVNNELLTPEEIGDFVKYWCEPSSTGRFKFSLQKTWDTNLRMHNALKMIYTKRRDSGGLPQTLNRQPTLMPEDNRKDW